MWVLLMLLTPPLGVAIGQIVSLTLLPELRVYPLLQIAIMLESAMIFSVIGPDLKRFLFRSQSTDKRESD